MAKKKNNKTTRCREKKKVMQTEMKTLYLSFDLIIEILLRLPVKSLIRFKCVCKSWFSLISHPNFANSHFKVTAASRILFISPFKTPMFQSIDFEINHDFTTLNHDFLPPKPPYSHYEIKGSCRGFMLLHSNGEDLWIWNPSSGIHKQIPIDSELCSWCYRYLCGFGYDHSRDDYLVVISTVLANRSSQFFSLRDNMWNEIGCTDFTYFTIIREHTCGSFINGAIHWLAAKSHDLPLNNIIVAFDLIEKKWFEMPLPDDFHHHGGDYSLWLWVFGEFLSLWSKDCKNHIVEIWVMKEYKQHSSWTKTLVIRDNRKPIYKPVCRSKSGDIIGEDFDNRLVRYNNKGQLLKSPQTNWRDYRLAMYTESLFSLPGDCEQI